MKVYLKSGFMRGASLRTVTGQFPNFKVHILAEARECTWHDDPDTSKVVEVGEDDPRPLFKQRFWGVSAYSYEYDAQPINEAAQRLCEQPLPSGWKVRIQKAYIPGAKVDYRTITSEDGATMGDYLLDLVAGREPVLCPPGGHH
jgi:hypothetical protein